jgi:hypothetical protein
VSVMSRKQVIVPAEMQRRARRIATQASKLADQARPMTKAASTSAKRGAGTAADWARPHVIRARTWMAVGASRGSVAVQDKVAPKVSAMMAAAAKRLDPPKRRSSRLPKLLAGTALLAAGAAAATAMAIRNRTGIRTMPPPPMPSQTPGATSSGTSGQPTVPDPSADSARSRREADVNGLSRTR